MASFYVCQLAGKNRLEALTFFSVAPIFKELLLKGILLVLMLENPQGYQDMCVYNQSCGCIFHFSRSTRLRTYKFNELPHCQAECTIWEDFFRLPWTCSEFRMM